MRFARFDTLILFLLLLNPDDFLLLFDHSCRLEGIADVGALSDVGNSTPVSAEIVLLILK